MIAVQGSALQGLHGTAAVVQHCRVFFECIHKYRLQWDFVSGKDTMCHVKIGVMIRLSTAQTHLG